MILYLEYRLAFLTAQIICKHVHSQAGFVQMFVIIHFAEFFIFENEMNLYRKVFTSAQNLVITIVLKNHKLTSNVLYIVNIFY